MASDTTWTTTADTDAWRGAGAGTFARETKPAPGADPCCPPCPDCGGLECLCRPRFFAGQLLTERELNALQDYVVAKDRLHNRYLVGAGIACGLEALCDPCGGGVRVTPGYAVSPCGEDIVVCRTDLVDVCALVRRCRESDEPDCRPYAPGKDGCGDVLEQWVLTIRYAEAPSRAAPPATTACGCGGKAGCGGGGGKAGGCGCGGGGGCSSAPAEAVMRTRRSAEPALRRGAPPACVPQFTCESYRYDVFRLPEDEPTDPERDPRHPLSGQLAGLTGPLAARLRCCIREIEDAVPPLPAGQSADPAFRRRAIRWICDVKANLRRLVLRRGSHDCSLLARLAAVPMPPEDDVQAFDAAMAVAGQQLLEIVFELVIDCLCSALLPACPEGDDPRIPIAVVTVRRNPCEVVSVCNWTPLRRQLVTWPVIGYWLGWLPQIAALRRFLHLMCCERFGFFDREREVEREAPGLGAGMAARGAASGTMFARSLASVAERRAAGRATYDAGPGGLDMADLMALFAGPRGAKDLGAREDAADRVLGEMLRPLREAMPLDALAGVLGGAQPGTAALEAEVSELRRALAAQEDRLAALERGGGR